VKSFSFGLDRVLLFRRREMERVEERLRQLALRLSRAREIEELSHGESAVAKRDLARLETFSGGDLRRLDLWLSRLISERGRARQTSAGLEDERSKILQELIEKRRGVKALERLRERRWRAYAQAAQREVERESAELHLARWMRRKAPEE
jgi:hypothetical protein